MSKRVALGCCALGLALLAGCSLYAGDPAAPPPSDPPPPPLPPPDPPPPPPPPLGDNVPGDEYDAANHRLLLPDCASNALLAVDLTTGERSVLIDLWPWTEPGSEPCVQMVTSDHGGRRAVATVRRSILDPDDDGGGPCSSTELVTIDTETRAVTEIRNIRYVCCGDGGDQRASSLQFDEVRRQLLYLETNCSTNYCDYYLTGVPYGTGESVLVSTLYTPDCYPDDDGCSGETWFDVQSLAFDPTAPGSRMLLLVRQYLTRVYRLDSLDVATGATAEVATVQATWSDFQVEDVLDFSVDIEKQRALVTAVGRGASSQRRFVVIAVDLVTGLQTLLYDGQPTADGSQLACRPNPAFDSRERRLLLVEPLDGYDCASGIFAVDADTGAFTRIADRVN